MTCREFIDGLMDYVDHELATDELQEVEKHLAICPDCLTYLRSYSTTVKLGKQAFVAPGGDAQAPVPEDVMQRILEAVKPRADRRHRTGEG